MTQYSEIRNFRQLVTARKALDYRIDEQEKKLGARFTAAREFYTPANLALMALRQATSMLNAGKIALLIVRTIRDYLNRKKEESAGIKDQGH